jgi:hypothetical protein
MEDVWRKDDIMQRRYVLLMLNCQCDESLQQKRPSMAGESALVNNGVVCVVLGGWCYNNALLFSHNDSGSKG